MKGRPIFLLLVGVMVLNLTACKKIDQPPEPITEPVPTAAPEPVHTVVVYPPDVPPGDYAPWQTAYADFLTERLGEDARVVESGAEGEWSNMYCLYDVDGDGSPELFVQYGHHEIADLTRCYAFRDGEVKELGEIPSTWGRLYTCPGEAAVLFWWRHTGYAEIFKIPMVNGELGEWELLLAEDTKPSANDGEVRDYTDPAELVPGAEPIPYYDTRACRDWGRNTPLTLPIYDYGALPRTTEEPLEEAEVRAAVGEVLWENRVFSGHSGDNLHGRPGDMTLAECLAAGAYPGRDRPLFPRGYAFADGNGDGQTDCVLRLEEEPDGYGNIAQYYMVFHVQEGEVHAYFFAWKDGLGVDPDGTVYFREGDDWEQISFYGDQCYAYPTRRAPVEGCDLAWDPFLPPEAAPPPGDYAPWQTAYMDFLIQLCEREAPLWHWQREVTQQEWEEADPEQRKSARELSQEYWLYDVDKDGVPELFVCYGDYYYAPWVECYQYQEGKVAQIGEIYDAKGSRFFTWPGKNAILNYWAWKGAFILWEYSIVDGKLVCMDEDGIASQFGGPGEPDPRDYVPGTVYIEPVSVRLARPENTPMLLPLWDYGGRTVPPVTQAQRAAGREAIQGVLFREEPFYGLAGGGSYEGDTGWVSFEEYCRAGTVKSYEPLIPMEKVWIDLDRDGAEECVVRFQDHDGVTVFHWQDGVVYAYFLGYYSYVGNLTADGVFYFEEPRWVTDCWGRVLSFHRNQCYLSCVPRPKAPVPAAWEPFAQNP